MKLINSHPAEALCGNPSCQSQTLLSHRCWSKKKCLSKWLSPSSWARPTGSCWVKVWARFRSTDECTSPLRHVLRRHLKEPVLKDQQPANPASPQTPTCMTPTPRQNLFKERLLVEENKQGFTQFIYTNYLHNHPPSSEGVRRAGSEHRVSKEVGRQSTGYWPLLYTLCGEPDQQRPRGNCFLGLENLLWDQKPFRYLRFLWRLTTN